MTVAFQSRWTLVYAMKLTSCSLFVFLAGLAGAVPRPESANVKRQVSQLRNGGYDFIIAGGGTSGLTVADRLSEAFPNSKFCILKTGFHNIS